MQHNPERAERTGISPRPVACIQDRILQSVWCPHLPVWAGIQLDLHGCHSWECTGRGTSGAGGVPHKLQAIKLGREKYDLLCTDKHKRWMCTVTSGLGWKSLTDIPKRKGRQDPAFTHKNRSLETKQDLAVTHPPSPHLMDFNAADYGKNTDSKTEDFFGLIFSFFIFFFFWWGVSFFFFNFILLYEFLFMFVLFC